jgi:DNA-binding response OmpR family regulator
MTIVTCAGDAGELPRSGQSIKCGKRVKHRAIRRGGLTDAGERAMKILVVEAEETVREVMGVMLSRLGYKTALTSNCDEAFRTYCDNGPYDVVLIAMKFMRRSRAGGAKFIEDLLQKNPRQHYAFVTGSPVLRKPFTLQDLDDFMGAFRRPASSRFQ